MTEDNLNKIKSTQVLELIRVAHEFCIYTEEIENKDIMDLLSFYQKVLPLLYLKGSLMPDIKVSDTSFNERFVTEEHWEKIYMSLKTKLGDDDFFWHADENNELIKLSVADYMADIYQDMKDFVVLFQKDRLAAKENAIFSIKKYHAIHWGPRLTDILPVFHKLLFAKEIALNEETDI
ncbi:MAG: hypothetical protein DRI86_15130 [Bacteroidetes bacterium]|nr:MAG: hypothetical protein DRI86_15130 [Bacteroidota bacterium]